LKSKNCFQSLLISFSKLNQYSKIAIAIGTIEIKVCYDYDSFLFCYRNPNICKICTSLKVKRPFQTYEKKSLWLHPTFKAL